MLLYSGGLFISTLFHFIYLTLLKPESSSTMNNAPLFNKPKMLWPLFLCSYLPHVIKARKLFILVAFFKHKPLFWCVVFSRVGAFKPISLAHIQFHLLTHACTTFLGLSFQEFHSSAHLSGISLFAGHYSAFLHQFSDLHMFTFKFITFRIGPRYSAHLFPHFLANPLPFPEPR